MTRTVRSKALNSDQLFFVRRNFWEFRRHFPDLADNLYASLDASTQKALDRERDGSASNGTSSMSASLRGSNSSLNSMPSSVISMCILCLFCNRFGYSRHVRRLSPSANSCIVSTFFLYFHRFVIVLVRPQSDVKCLDCGVRQRQTRQVRLKSICWCVIHS